jgi:hypothetical protein
MWSLATNFIYRGKVKGRSMPDHRQSGLASAAFISHINA